jgi:MFS family permease
MKKYEKINLKYAIYALILLSLLNLLNYADRSIFNALLDPIKGQFAFSDVQLGWLASSFLLMYALAAYPFARWADRGVRKRVLVFGAFLWSLATFLTGMCRSYFQLFLARGFLGIGEAAYATTVAPLLSDYFPASLRASALGLVNAPLGIGTAIGFYIAGLSVKFFSWRKAFFFLGIPGILLSSLALFLREPKMGLGDSQTRTIPNRSHMNLPFGTSLRSLAARKQASGLPRLSQMKSLFAIKTLRYLWGSSILLTFSLGGMLVWMTSLLHRDYGFSVAEAAIRGAEAATIGSILGVFVGGISADLWNRFSKNAYLWIVIVGFLFSGLLALFFFYVKTKLGVLGCIGGIAFFQMASNGPFLAAMMNVTVPPLRSTANAIYLFLIHLLGDAPSPTIIGYLSKWTGNLKSALFFMPWIALLSAIVAMGGLKYYDKEKRSILGNV